MADKTSKEIQESIDMTRLGLKIARLDLSGKQAALESKQEELDRFYKEEWFPTVNNYEKADEVPYELWNKRISLMDFVEDLKQEINNINKNIDERLGYIKSLEEKLRQAQEKEEEEARKVSETIEEEPTEEISTEASETIEEEPTEEMIEEAEKEPNLDQLLAILEGKEAANTLEVPEEAYEEPEGISEEVEKEPEGIPKEIEEEPEIISEEVTKEPEIISEEVTKKPENEINQRTVAERETNPSAIFKRASDETRNSKAISTKKTWTQILMNKIKELAKKGKDAVDNFFNR